jgi:DNA (cytosine-5)-methyltransferase 1
MPELTFGDLFAGIGGISLGLERAGMKCVFQVEIDEYCRRVLAKHWPYVRRHDDVKTFPPKNQEEWQCDLLAGGFPCQDISNAGKHAGITGSRSGLWGEFARVIRVLRPRFVLVENVSALLGRGLGEVLRDLAACGYDAEWDCLPAAAFGAPHIRDRLFLVAYATTQRCEEGRELQSGLRPQRVARRGQEDVPDANGERREGEGIQRTTAERGFVFFDADRESLGRIAESWGQRGEWATEPDVGRVASRVPSRVDRLGGLGNAVVPQVAEWIGRRMLECLN